MFQKRNLRAICNEVVLLLLSAFVLALSFPSFCSKSGFGFFVFLALIPVFIVVRSASFKIVWFYGFLYGYVFYWIFNFWLSAFHPLANVLVQVIKGAEMALLFLGLKIADRVISKKFSYVLQAFIWVAYSYLAQSWFAGYPYGTVAYALYRYKLLIQIADFSGIWLLNFIIVLPQAYFGRWIYDRLTNLSSSLLKDILENWIVLSAYSVLIVFQLIYGILMLNRWKNIVPDSNYKIATVQHNSDSWAGGYDTYKRNFNTLKKLSLEAKEMQPDMIVWSETAFVPSVDWYTTYPYVGSGKGPQFDYLRKTQELVEDFVVFGENLGIPLVTGNPSSKIQDNAMFPYDEFGNWNKDDYNSVILFDNGMLKDSYLKQHLVPFTEHFPYQKQLPWLYNLLKANGYNWWEMGHESKVFEDSNGIKFSTPICFEDIFGYLCADFVKNGADLLINLTNDSWSGSEVAERQHAYMAVFRAVETRKSVLRGTNSGISCLILPTGKIVGEMEPFKVGFKIWDVPVYSNDSYSDTLYVRYSDTTAKLFVYCALFGLLFGTAKCIVVRVIGKKRSTSRCK